MISYLTVRYMYLLLALPTIHNVTVIYNVMGHYKAFQARQVSQYSMECHFFGQIKKKN